MGGWQQQGRAASVLRCRLLPADTSCTLGAWRVGTDPAPLHITEACNAQWRRRQGHAPHPPKPTQVPRALPAAPPTFLASPSLPHRSASTHLLPCVAEGAQPHRGHGPRPPRRHVPNHVADHTLQAICRGQFGSLVRPARLSTTPPTANLTIGSPGSRGTALSPAIGIPHPIKDRRRATRPHPGPPNLNTTPFTGSPEECSRPAPCSPAPACGRRAGWHSVFVVYVAYCCLCVRGDGAVPSGLHCQRRPVHPRPVLLILRPVLLPPPAALYLARAAAALTHFRTEGQFPDQP